MSETSPVADLEQTEVGSYFVANYPPFSVWTPDAVATDATAALRLRGPGAIRRWGCTCTSRSAASAVISATSGSTPTRTRSEVEQYLDLLGREWELYASQPAIAGRPFDFVYFGGGTPSFLSTRQLESLVERLTASRSWDTRRGGHVRVRARHAHRAKLAAIRDIGVTRLSLGVENFNDRILEDQRPRASLARDHARLRAGAQARLSADQHRPDRRHARRDRRELGATASSGRSTLEPDSVTIYQMELPFNTTISGDLLKRGGQFNEPVASWATKRRWVAEAFEALERAGYTIGSAYTAVKDPAKTQVRLSRSPVGRRRPAGPRRRVVRPHQRRAHAEPRHLGDVRRRDRPRRDSARPRVSADATKSG